jgi:hypothetical protein
MFRIGMTGDTRRPRHNSQEQTLRFALALLSGTSR